MPLPLRLRGVTATTVLAVDERFHPALDFGFADGVHYFANKFDHENEAQMEAERLLKRLTRMLEDKARFFDSLLPTTRLGSEGAR